MFLLHLPSQKWLKMRNVKITRPLKKCGFKSLPVVNRAHMKSLLQLRYESFPWYRVVGFILSTQKRQDGYQFPLNRKLLFKQWWNTLDWQRARSFSQSIVTCIWNQLYTPPNYIWLRNCMKLVSYGPLDSLVLHPYWDNKDFFLGAGF